MLADSRAALVRDRGRRRRGCRPGGSAVIELDDPADAAAVAARPAAPAAVRGWRRAGGWRT